MSSNEVLSLFMSLIEGRNYYGSARSDRRFGYNTDTIWLVYATSRRTITDYISVRPGPNKMFTKWKVLKAFILMRCSYWQIREFKMDLRLRSSLSVINTMAIQWLSPNYHLSDLEKVSQITNIATVCHQITIHWIWEKSWMAKWPFVTELPLCHWLTFLWSDKW